MWGWLTLNIAYLVYTISGLFRDMFRLRVTLLIATSFFIAWGLIVGSWSVVLWNVPVAVAHSWRLWVLWREQRHIDLGPTAAAVHGLLYPDLSNGQFSRWWQVGKQRVIVDKVLFEKDSPVQELSLILSGEADVLVRNDLTVRLGSPRFLGEMSSVTGETASATVVAVGELPLRVWQAETLDALFGAEPEIERAHLRAIGKELTRKLI